MSDKSFLIPRDELMRVFGNPRTVVQFEEFQRTVAENTDTTGANVEATQALKDASFLTLSPNAELANEFVLRLGEGLRLIVEDGEARLYVDAAIVTSGHVVRLTTSGDTVLALPVSGAVATREWINASGPYADDAAAAADGVALGEVYRRGDKLAARLT